MNDTKKFRPVTSKARGICKYYDTPRGCFAGNTCKFLHAPDLNLIESSTPLLTPYDRAKRCRYFTDGYCKHGDKCWFLHVDDKTRRGDDDTDDIHCSICFETPVTFGLLDRCNHIFCLECIRQWRDPSGKAWDFSETSTIKKCPMCRANSYHVIPSSRYWSDSDGGKSDTLQKFKASMSRVPCKYFKQIKKENPEKPLCPFGKDCFYQHLNDDGSQHTFQEGKDIAMRTYRNRVRTSTAFLGARFRGIVGNGLIDPPGSDHGQANAVNLVGNIAMDMFDRMVTEVLTSTGERNTARSRRGGSRRGSHGPINDPASSRTRPRIVAGAVHTIQAELSQLDPRGTQGARPVVVQGTVPSPEWNWSRISDGEGSTWEAEDLTVTIPGVMADLMLGSLREFNGNTSLHPSEPVSIPVESWVQRDVDEDASDMRKLESLSHSSQIDVEGNSEEEPDEALSGDERRSVRGMQNVVRVLQASNGSGGISSIPEPPMSPPLASTSGSGRFRTVVEKEGTLGGIDEGGGTNQGADEKELESRSLEKNVAEMVTDPPPFVTDGRGRVVWSNKPLEIAETLSPVMTSPAEQDNSTTAQSRTCFGQVLDTLLL